MLFKNENGKLMNHEELERVLEKGQIFITENDNKGDIFLEEGIGRMDGNNGKYEVQRCSLVEIETDKDTDIVEIACENSYQILDGKLYNVEEVFEPISDDTVEKILHKNLRSKSSFKVEKSELIEMLKNQLKEIFLFNDFDIEVSDEEEDEEEYKIDITYDVVNILSFEFSKSEDFGYSYENVITI